MERTGTEDRQARQRIVALLFAFAALADRAGTRPRPVRVAVLWLLRAVEQIAREFVVAVAEESGVDPDLALLPCAHDIADDATRLARSFTALAELLIDLTRRCPLPPSLGIGDPVSRFMQAIPAPAHAQGAPAWPLPDTS